MGGPSGRAVALGIKLNMLQIFVVGAPQCWGPLRAPQPSRAPPHCGVCGGGSYAPDHNILTRGSKELTYTNRVFSAVVTK